MCCLSLIEATEKLKSNLVIFLGVGAFEQLFGPVRGEFEQTFSKNPNRHVYLFGVLYNK